MKENIKMVERKVMEHYSSQMVLNIQDSFQITRFMVMVFMNGQMEEFIKAIGNRVR